jgi:hypothetical protein
MIAFQGMKGRHRRFNLILRGEAMKPGEIIRLPSDPVIDISVTETTTTQTEFEEIALIKVFNDWRPSRTAVNYWVPRNTTNTFASINFRHWRYLAETFNGFAMATHDVEVWTDLNYRGDGVINGHRQYEWESLSKCMSPMRATGKLEKEEPYSEEKDDSSGESSESPESEGDSGRLEPVSFRPLVLKVLASPWRGDESKRAEKKAERKAKGMANLTRVSFRFSEHV